VKQAPPKNVDRQRVAAARKASQQKKLVIVFILFAAMAVLWIRFFVSKGGPKTVKAADVNLVIANVKPAVPEAVYVDLPVIASRQDVLANDLFAARNFKGFRRQGESAADSEADTADANEQLNGDLAAAAGQLELAAIVNDKKLQAFIGDELLEKGQSFRFVFHDQVYNFKVVNILEDRVELECNGIIIIKKMPESSFPSTPSTGSGRTSQD
jgi:hypothetical protein